MTTPQTTPNSWRKSWWNPAWISKALDNVLKQSLSPSKLAEILLDKLLSMNPWLVVEQEWDKFKATSEWLYKIIRWRVSGNWILEWVWDTKDAAIIDLYSSLEWISGMVFNPWEDDEMIYDYNPKWSFEFSAKEEQIQLRMKILSEVFDSNFNILEPSEETWFKVIVFKENLRVQSPEWLTWIFGHGESWYEALSDLFRQLKYRTDWVALLKEDDKGTMIPVEVYRYENWKFVLKQKI